MAKVNLGLNLVISFLPTVNMWAHLGGGVVGACLVASGLATRSVPPPAPKAPASSGPPAPKALRTAAWLGALAVCIALSIASI